MPISRSSKTVGALLTMAAGAVTAAWVPAIRTHLEKPIVSGQVETFFSPRGGCTDAIIRTIASARKSIHVQAYSFTSAPIAQALVAAHRRGVKTEVILDSSQKSEKYTEADFLTRAGVPTFIDSAHAIAHNKLMIIDEMTVVTGSFNFTKSAEERNAENVLILHQTPELAQKYLSNWRAHQRHSPAYPRP
jgi:phosphatidylserine/phosphatidylglycerophosphate/cardiolipin synthase-like enzyme